MAAEQPVRFRRSCSSCFRRASTTAGESEGAFDITVGPLMKVWGFYKGTGQLPHRAEVRAALARVGYRHIHPGSRRPDGAVSTGRAWSWIPGGIGKGYAVDRMVEVLKQTGIHDRAGLGLRQQHLRSGGAAGRAAGLAEWRSAIPKHAKQDAAEVFLKDMSHVHLGQLREVFPGRRPHLQLTSWTRARVIRRRACCRFR